MTTRNLKKSHGITLIETKIVEGSPPKVVGRQYTVKVIWRPKPLYQGPDLAAAERIFEHRLQLANS